MTTSQQSVPTDDQAPAPLHHEFTATGPIDLNVQNLRGVITLRSEPGTAVRVQLSPHGAAARQLVDRLIVRFDHDRLTVDVPADEFGRVGADLGGLLRSFGSGGDGVPLADRLAGGVRSLMRSAEGLGGGLDITVLVPAASRAVLSTGAGDVRISGPFGSLEARTATGDIALERAAETWSRLSTGAGDITVGPGGGDISAKTGTGDLLLEEVHGEVSLTTGLGDVTVRRARAGAITARTGLGDVLVQVEPGTATRVDLATGLGDRDVQLTPTDGAGQAGNTLEIEARSGKGDLRVLRASPAHSASMP